MAAPGKPVKEKKKPLLVKTSLNNPYSLNWPTLEKGQARFILKTVTEKLEKLGLRKNDARVFRKWGNKKNRKKKKASDSAEATESIRLDTEDSDQPDLDQSNPFKTTPVKPGEPIRSEAEEPSNSKQLRSDTEESVQPGWSVRDVRTQLAIGINEVTKGLERNELSLVLVCDSVKPAHVTAHLIPLSKSRCVPACQLRGLSASLGAALGIGSVLALGFKRAAAAFTDTVSELAPAVPPLEVAWVPVHVTDPEPQREEPGSRKRKLQESRDPSEDQTRSLQPLRVKKVIPNPSKSRKPKTKQSK